MFFLEIQEGKDAMRRAPFCKEMGAEDAACALRVGLGAVGQRLEGAGRGILLVYKCSHTQTSKRRIDLL